MKTSSYLIHIPMIIAGMIVATLWAGFGTGFDIAIKFWSDVE